MSLSKDVQQDLRHLDLASQDHLMHTSLFIRNRVVYPPLQPYPPFAI